MNKTYTDPQTWCHGVTSPINIDSNACFGGVTRRHDSCQCDLCREGEELEAVTAAVLSAERETSGVRTLPDETNATLSQPGGKTGQHEPPETLNHPIISPTSPKVSSIHEEIDDSKPTVICL